MSDDLIISGSGSYAIATDELYASAQQLGALSTEAGAISVQLSWIDRIESSAWLAQVGAPQSAMRAEDDIYLARVLLVEVELQARLLQYGVNTAADGYGFVELIAAQQTHGLIGNAAALAGAFWPVASVASATLVTAGLLGGFDKDDASRLFSNPVMVAATREAVMAADDAMMGAAGVPHPVARLIGDEGFGLSGVALAAGGLVVAGSAVGAFVETETRVSPTSAGLRQAPPSGFAERLDRIPAPSAGGGAQVIIEKYEQPGRPDRFEVYIAGTVRFDALESTEPWDLTSNVVNATDRSSGSYRSVVQAMSDAGIDKSSPVQFTGYSQGGGIAALLAASGDYNTQGVVSFGGPTGQTPIPSGVPVVLVEHTDDIVPALGGAQDNREAVIVQRNAFGGVQSPVDEVIPAHQLASYRETAGLMDEAKSSQVREAISKLDRFGLGATRITSTQYTCVRVSSGPS